MVFGLADGTLFKHSPLGFSPLLPEVPGVLVAPDGCFLPVCCSPSPSNRITQALTLSSHSLRGEIFLDPGSIFHLQALSGHDIFFDASKLNNGSLETSGFLKAQQNDLSGNLFVSLLDVMATPRITFFKSPFSGAEKDLCTILNSSVISGRRREADHAHLHLSLLLPDSSRTFYPFCFKDSLVNTPCMLLKFIYIYSMCINVLPACIYVHSVCGC